MGNSANTNEINNPKLLFIGRNSGYEFGLNHNRTLTQLTQCKQEDISKIFAGYGFNLYSNDNLEMIWSAGDNKHGQCAISDESEIKKYREITYFKRHNIALKKICCSPIASTVYFITKKNKVYGVGDNYYNQRGIPVGSNRTCSTPTLIRQLHDVIDIVMGGRFSIALIDCKWQFAAIISNWCRKYKVIKDIEHFIQKFVPFSKVLSTSKARGSGHKTDVLIQNRCSINYVYNMYEWKEIEEFKYINIIKISAGNTHSLFLEENGIVWSCGAYKDVPIVNGTGSSGAVVRQICYFMRKDIKIIDIQSGHYHNLAVDIKGNVYCWGLNRYGQCGDGTTDTISEPKRLQYFDQYQVEVVKCGSMHSYVKTKCKKHYMFGWNKFVECLKFDGTERVTVPHRIDDVMCYKVKGIESMQVFLGHCNTAIAIC